MGQVAAKTLDSLPSDTFEILYCADTKIYQLYWSFENAVASSFFPNFVRFSFTADRSIVACS